MSASVGDFVLNRLVEWGVRRVFGYPGDGINGLLGALRAVGDRLDFLQVRHEEPASFAGLRAREAHRGGGRVHGDLGPGAIHLLNGLYDAKLDHQPVLATVPAGAHVAGVRLPAPDDGGAGPGAAPDRPGDAGCHGHALAHVRDRPERRAGEPVRAAPRAHGAVFSSQEGIGRPRLVPGERLLGRAAEILNDGERVAILVGQGAKGAAAEVEQVADLLGAGVAKALNGRAVLPDDLPYVTGSIGLLGPSPPTT